jgi:membrane protein DedA with SNARE-associated domain
MTDPQPRWPSIGEFALFGTAWLVDAVSEVVTNINLDGLDYLYALVFMFVSIIAVVLIFPSESLLNARSVLATQNDSDIEI